MSATDLGELLAGAEVEDLAHGYFVGMPRCQTTRPSDSCSSAATATWCAPTALRRPTNSSPWAGMWALMSTPWPTYRRTGRVHGGLKAADLQSNAGFAQLGIDTFPPFVGHAVLLDVASVHDVECLEPGYEVTVADLERAVDRRAVEIREGDVILVGTGWSRRWSDRETFIGYAGGVPGPGVAAAHWLAERRPRAVGAESGRDFERLQPGAGHALLPVHRIMLVESGINIIETMNLDALLRRGVGEFVLVLNPLPVIGADWRAGASASDPAVTGTTVAYELARFASACRGRLPAEVLDDAAGRVVNCVGNALAASASSDPGEPHVALLDVLQARGGRPDSSLFVKGPKLPASAAALINGTLAHALDFDDTHLPSVLHPSASVRAGGRGGRRGAGRLRPRPAHCGRRRRRDHQPARHDRVRRRAEELDVLRQGTARHVDLRHDRFRCRCRTAARRGR